MSTSPKKVLRSEIKSRLSKLCPESIATQSQIAQDLILSTPQYQSAKRLSIYLSMPDHEAQTDVLVRHALEADKKVFVPYLCNLPIEESAQRGRGKKAMEMLQLRDLREYMELQRDAWGIPSLGIEGLEKRENALGGQGFGQLDVGKDEDVGLDLIVVPGVAFDETMGRLGHGAGFYDRFLSRYKSWFGKKPFLFGLCLTEQLLKGGESLPTDQWDHMMDAVAVGDGGMRTLES